MIGTARKIFTYILAVWLFTLVNTESDEKTPCAVIEGANYERELINENIFDPHMLTIDYATNTLFFSYMALSSSYNTYKVSRYVNLKTKEYGKVHGVKGGFSHAVDRNNNQVYIGGKDGIYKFDYSTKRGNLIGQREKNYWIFNMFYKDKLYFTLSRHPFKMYEPKKLYTFENGQAQIVEALKDTNVNMIVLDKNNNIFISNDTGIYKFNKDFQEGKQYVNYGNIFLTTDINGDVYYSTLDTINKIDADGNVKKLAHFPMFLLYGIAIDSDGNIIYAENKNIYRFKPTNTKCTEPQKITI